MMGESSSSYPGPGMRRACAAALATLIATGGGALGWSAMAAVSPHLVSQRNRSFQPGTIEIRRGETVRIVNDDGELLHHAHVKSDTFSFDSGEQEPGKTVDITFPAGTYLVQCAIHLKMRLVVVAR